MTRQDAGAEVRHASAAIVVAAAVALPVVAAVFLLLALFSLGRGLGQLFVFAVQLLVCGFAVAELDGFDRQLGRTVYSLTGPLMWGALGATALAAARRMRLRLDIANAREDRRPPVVYLRSFAADSRLSRRPAVFGRVASFRTEEEQLVDALRECGPIVALGKPGERLPRLGARRVYVADADWRQQVLSWFGRAALLVIHIPANATEGLTWEIERSLSMIPLSRLVFVVSRDARALQWIVQQLGDRVPTEPPPWETRRGPYGSSVGGVLYFVDDRAEFRALIKPPFFQRPFFSPLVAVYRLALQAVTTRTSGSWRPLPAGFGDAIIASIWMAFLVAVIAAAVDQQTVSQSRQDPWALPSCRGSLSS